MAVRAEQPEILEPVVIRKAIDVVELKHEALTEPFVGAADDFDAATAAGRDRSHSRLDAEPVRYHGRVLCTLFSVSEAELLEATGDLPAYSEGDSLQQIVTSPVGLVLELGVNWRDVHVALGNHDDDQHPLGFLVAGGEVAPSMVSASASGRCFKPAATVELLAWVARLDEPRVRKLRQFLADAVLAKHGVIVHHFS